MKIVDIYEAIRVEGAFTDSALENAFDYVKSNIADYNKTFDMGKYSVFQKTNDPSEYIIFDQAEPIAFYRVEASNGLNILTGAGVKKEYRNRKVTFEFLHFAKEHLKKWPICMGEQLSDISIMIAQVDKTFEKKWVNYVTKEEALFNPETIDDYIYNGPQSKMTRDEARPWLIMFQ